jgi:hypothetical protein
MNSFAPLGEGGDGGEGSKASDFHHGTDGGFSHLFSGGSNPDLELDPFVDVKNALPSSDGGIGGFIRSNRMGFDLPKARYRAQYTNEDTIDDNPFGFPDSMLKDSGTLISDPFESDPFSNWENQALTATKTPQAAGDLGNVLPPRPSSKSTAQKLKAEEIPSLAPSISEQSQGAGYTYEEDDDDDRDNAYESMLDAECDRLRELLEGKFHSLNSRDFKTENCDEYVEGEDDEYEQ